MEGWSKPFGDDCSTTHFYASTTKLIAHTYAISFLLVYIGFLKHSFNYVSYWFSIYNFLGMIGGIFEILLCGDSENTFYNFCHTLFITLHISLWLILILITFHKRYNKHSIQRVSQIMLAFILFIILPIQIINLFTVNSGMITNALRLPGIVGLFFHIVIYFQFFPDKLSNICEAYIILLFCGIIVYFVATVSLIFSDYVWGLFLIYSYFFFGMFWFNYLEQQSPLKIYDTQSGILKIINGTKSQEFDVVNVTEDENDGLL
eukprot:288692_1